MAGRKAHVETYGCTFNQAEGRIMERLLSEAGWSIARAAEDADVLVLNTCAVKDPTENRIIERMRKLREEGRRFVVCGCLTAYGRRIRGFAPDSPIVETQAIASIADAADDALSGQATLYQEHGPKDGPVSLGGGLVLEVPINDGCAGRCNYCATKLARPFLRSIGRQAILRWIGRGIESGAKEIRLTSPDTGAYGLDRGDSLAGLLSEIGDLVARSGRRDVRVRLGMINPQHAARMKEGLARELARPHMFRFIHIPAQSGSGKVLRDMERGHGPADFEETVDYLRKHVEGITIATDLIAGYPTESEGDHLKSMELLERVRPEFVNVSKFCPRPGTRAGSMRQLDETVRKKRAAQLVGRAKELAAMRNEALIGGEGEALAIEEAEGRLICRDRSYRRIVIEGSRSSLGSWIRARISKAGPWSLEAGRITPGPGAP